MHVLSVNLGTVADLPGQVRPWRSAIGKRPSAGPVAVGPSGLAGDAQADLERHGGLTRAVYAYPARHLAFWQTVRAQAGVAGWHDPMPPGLLGENLTIQGLDERELWVGDRWHLPGCVLVVTTPRRPCGKLNAALGFAHAASLMRQSGFCGTYLAVLEAGQIAPGDPIRVEPGPREIGLLELFRKTKSTHSRE